MDLHMEHLKRACKNWINSSVESCTQLSMRQFQVNQIMHRQERCEQNIIIVYMYMYYSFCKLVWHYNDRVWHDILHYIMGYCRCWPWLYCKCLPHNCSISKRQAKTSQVALCCYLHAYSLCSFVYTCSIKKVVGISTVSCQEQSTAQTGNMSAPNWVQHEVLQRGMCTKDRECIYMCARRTCLCIPL